MSSRVDAEEIEPTRSEKLLAVLLGIFLLVGTVWFYVEVPGWVDDAMPGGDRTAVEQAQEREMQADEAMWNAETQRDEKSLELDLAREEYKVALQEGTGAEAAKAEYDRVQQEYDRAATDLTEARDESSDARAEVREAQEEFDQENRTGAKAWAVAMIRLVFIAGWTFGAYRLIGSLRQRESRYLALAFAGAAVGAVMALVFAVDYLVGFIDPLELGPIVLSVLGVVATIGAFRVLQKFLAARLPGRRVRKGECPFCGFPSHDSGLDAGAHCAGCGREVVGDCATCGATRRVGSSFCVSCGSA